MFLWASAREAHAEIWRNGMWICQLSPILQTLQVWPLKISENCDHSEHSFNQHPGRGTGEAALLSHRKGARPGTIVNPGK